MKDFDIERLIGRVDYSAGTEAFAENLLQNCLAVLGKEDEGTVLADDDLEMLSAAGNLPMLWPDDQE